MKIRLLLACLTILSLTTGCVTRDPPDYTNLLASNPQSILVLMPNSLASDVNAGPAVLSSITIPLTERGYYVFPVALVNDTFRYNGVTEAAEMRNISFEKLHEIYGADAILDLTIEDYSSHYEVLDSVFKVQVNAQLIDLRTKKLLWSSKCLADNSSNSNSDPLSTIIAALFKHIFNNVTDQGFKVSNKYAQFTFSDFIYPPLLRGPYSKDYRKDKILSQVK